MQEDVIYRQEAIDALVKRTHLPWEDLKILNPMLEVLEQIPSAEPKRKMGHWIVRNEYSMRPILCSECGEWQSSRSKFCPECGAQMDLKGD